MAGSAHSTGFLQGSLTATLPASADVTTRDWLQSGMIVQLLQVRTLPVTAASTTSGVSPGEGITRVPEQCIARGVLQPDALLGGVTKEWSGRLILVKEVPLLDAKGVRLGLRDGETGTDEVCKPTWHIGIAHGCMTTVSLMTCIQGLVISHAVSSQAPWHDFVHHARCGPAACPTACNLDHSIYSCICNWCQVLRQLCVHWSRFAFRKPLLSKHKAFCQGRHIEVVHSGSFGRSAAEVVEPMKIGVVDLRPCVG